MKFKYPDLVRLPSKTLKKLIDIAEPEISKVTSLGNNIKVELDETIKQNIVLRLLKYVRSSV
jgi:hypothetical protein